ncbi:hypothetical protein [Mesorhizobium sp. 128a]
MDFTPQLVHERHGEVPLFVRLLGESEYVGEIGLDGGDEFARHLDLQKDVFDRLLRACSQAGGRVMSIHSRHAPDLFRMPRRLPISVHGFP